MKYTNVPDKVEPGEESPEGVPPSHSLLTIAKVVAHVLAAPFVALGKKLNGHKDDGPDERRD